MRTLAALAALVLVCAAGCSADAESVAPTPLPSSPAPLPSIEPSAVVAFPRTLQADRMVEVQIASAHGDGTVVELTLESPLFVGPMRAESVSRTTPGFPARLRVPLGEAVCPAPPGPTTASYVLAPPFTTREEVEPGSTSSGSATVDPDVLAQIHATECRARLATDAAAPSFAQGAVPAAGELVTAVELSRGSSEAQVTLTQLTGNVIFSLEAAPDALPVTLTADQGGAAVPVTVTATRCDAHAFAESKKTFVFVAVFDVEGERIAVEYRAEGQVREALQALFDACGEGSGSDGIGGQ